MITLLLFALSLGDSDISGIYAVSGKDGETDYTGAAVIRRVSGDRYTLQAVHCSIEDGSPTGYGTQLMVGIRDGNKISFGWKHGEASGVNIYTISETGSLSGRWTMIPGSRINVESLKKIGPLPKVMEEA